MLSTGRHRIALAVILATILIDFAGFSILIPVLPNLVDRLGGDAFHVGALTALYALGLVVFLPVWGWVSDRIGRRPVLLVSLAGTACSFLLFAVADSLPTAYAARALGGIFGASIGTAQAYITDLTDRDSRTEGMGLIGAASGFGLLVGVALGGVLHWVDPDLPFYAPAGFAGGAFALALLTLPESRSHDHEATWGGLARALIPAPLLIALDSHSGAVRLYLLLFLIIFLSFSALEAMFPLFAGDRFQFEELGTGLFMAAIMLVLGGVQALLVAPLTRVLGEPALTTAGLIAMGVSCLLLGSATTLPVLVVAGVGVAVGAGLSFPTFTSLFSQACSEREAGEALSQSQAMVHTGRTLGGFAWGYAFFHAGAGAPFFLSGIGMLVAAGLFVALRGRLLGGP